MAEYEKLPDPPEKVNSGNVLARMIDGLGFRYNCATEGLNHKDICFKPSQDQRNIDEIINHIYNLMRFIGKAFGLDLTKYKTEKTFKEIRNTTLTLMYDMSCTLKNLSHADFLAIKMQPYHNNEDYSFWFLLNGPIEDVLTHIGQINALRRISGNPVREYSPLKGVKL